MRSTRFPVVLKKKKALPPIVSTAPIIFILSNSSSLEHFSDILFIEKVHQVEQAYVFVYSNAMAN